MTAVEVIPFSNTSILVSWKPPKYSLECKGLPRFSSDSICIEEYLVGASNDSYFNVLNETKVKYSDDYSESPQKVWQLINENYF